MDWLWKSRKPVPPIVEPDCESRYEQLARTYAVVNDERAALKQEVIDCSAENLDLRSTEADLKLWIVQVCELIPQLKVRSDREAPKVKAQLDVLVIEAQKKEWIAKDL